MEIILRKAAKALGARHYFTGKPCKHGHIAARRTSSGQCLQCNSPSDPKYKAKYRAKHKAAIAAAQAEWKTKNKESVTAYQANYYLTNTDKYRTYENNRRALKRKYPGKLSSNLPERLYALQKGKCACCGAKLGNKYHLDHRMPLALGGSNTDDNMQLLTPKCNLQKHAKHPVDFMQERGFLI
jgi:5-methylcytosine-specific restriction endonuclease McrA